MDRDGLHSLQFLFLAALANSVPEAMWVRIETAVLHTAWRGEKLSLTQSGESLFAHFDQ